MDLTSILVILYAVSGDVHESEVQVPHAQCVAASAALTKAIKGPRKARPAVEMINGRLAPMISAECLPACVPDAFGLEPLELLTKGDDA